MALAFLRTMESLTGMDITGTAEERQQEQERRRKLSEELQAADPWDRWRALEAEVLKGGGTVILDGATGTEIERLAGRESMNKHGWSCSANFTYPDIVKQVHYSYLVAGADIITSNTYATNGNVMQGAGMGRVASAATKAAVRLAVEAREEYLLAHPECRRQPLVAGSMSCHPPKQEEGSCFDGGEWPDPMTEIENNAAHCKLLAAAGVDLIVVEMVWDCEHGERAVKAACETNLPVFLCLSCPIQENTSVMTAVRGQLACNQPLKIGGLGDVPLTEAVKRLTANRPNIVALCIHHTPLSLMPHAIAASRSVWKGYLGAYPEHGTFEMPHWTYENLDTEEFVSHAEVWKQGSRVSIIGGCCGIGPRHIEALSNAFKTPSPPPATAAAATTASSPIASPPSLENDLVSAPALAALRPPPALAASADADANAALPPPPQPMPAAAAPSPALPMPPVVSVPPPQPMPLPPQPAAAAPVMPAPLSSIASVASGEKLERVASDLSSPCEAGVPRQPSGATASQTSTGCGVVSASATPVSGVHAPYTGPGGSTPSPEPTPSASETTTVVTKTPSPEAHPSEVPPQQPSLPLPQQPQAQQAQPQAQPVFKPHVPRTEELLGSLSAGRQAPFPEAPEAAAAAASVAEEEGEPPKRSLSPLSMLMSGQHGPPKVPSGPSGALAAFAAMSEERFVPPPMPMAHADPAASLGHGGAPYQPSRYSPVGSSASSPLTPLAKKGSKAD